MFWIHATNYHGLEPEQVNGLGISRECNDSILTELYGMSSAFNKLIGKLKISGEELQLGASKSKLAGAEKLVNAPISDPLKLCNKLRRRNLGTLK